MFGIGETELAIIVLFAFLLFGPDKLPGMGRTIGRAIRQFREAQEGFTSVVQAEVIDPLNEAMGDPSQASKAKSARMAALDEDSDLDADADVPSRRSTETFAQRKARLEAERAAAQKEAASAQEEPVPSEPAPVSPADGTKGEGATVTGADEATAMSEGAPAVPEEVPAKPDTSAAALYAMRPRKRRDADSDTTVPAPDSDADSDADAAEPKEV
nr:twin-arginine translocase TatA/TatE family subunit [uncultured Olsenella sp.]